MVQLIAAGRTGEEVLDFVEDCDPRITQRLLDASPEGLRLFFTADPILREAMKLPRWETFFAEACENLYEPAEPVKPN